MDSKKINIQNTIDVIDYNDQNDIDDNVFDDKEYNTQNIIAKNSQFNQNEPHKKKYTCNYCYNNFSHKSSLYRHLKDRCKVRKENDAYMTKILNKLVEQMEDLKKENKNIVKENKKLYKKVDTLENGSNNNSNSHNNSHNNTTNVQNNINLLSFGNDNMEGISNEEIKKILKRGFKSIQLITKKTNFNPDIPENHNVYINNIKSQYAITYNKGRWELDKTEDVIDRIYDDKYGFLEQKYHELKNELKAYDRKKIERILDEYEGVKVTEIFGEIRLILYNNRHIPLRTRRLLNN
uniref:C2H2 type zinc finger protein n=1 Tax=Mimivirus LCMiAC02 TaxID=2506609 RepID=A0A481Z2A6_9VIRU|nr:MAG: C2H2 type zinc finger protein [Mimivirus LCMiAC02]